MLGGDVFRIDHGSHERSERRQGGEEGEEGLDALFKEGRMRGVTWREKSRTLGRRAIPMKVNARNMDTAESTKERVEKRYSSNEKWLSPGFYAIRNIYSVGHRNRS